MKGAAYFEKIGRSLRRTAVTPKFLAGCWVGVTLLAAASPSASGEFRLTAAEMDRVTAGSATIIGASDAFAHGSGIDALSQTVTDVSVNPTDGHAYGEALGAGEAGSFADAFSELSSGGAELSQTVDAVSVVNSEGTTVSGAVADVSLKTDGGAGTIAGLAATTGDLGFTEATASLAKATGSGEAAGVATGDALGSGGQPTASSVSGAVDSALNMKIGASASGNDVSNAGSAIGGTITSNGVTFSPLAGSSLSSTGEGSSAHSASFLRTVERNGVTVMFVGSVVKGSGEIVEQVADSSIDVTSTSGRVISKTIESERRNGARSFTFAIVVPEPMTLSGAMARRISGGFSAWRGG